ncbi:molybdate ABC transporter, permease protein [Schaalia georgiae F0490]|uniref:Molybdate ABC transporter, permease protein n=2 Tax=Schaalia georgiae TaxID=52768 RepID=J0XBJ9_9ACTO|nr:ABC transporter permease [Schaalia georgiae]EJF46046.1 molybdate ABC transporter, permease protein [Schaalia georgiae F0490]
MGKRRAPAVSPVPVWTAAVGGLALAFLVLPLVFMAGRVPWGRLPQILASEESVAALGLSLRTCAAALAIDLVLGVPAAVLLSRDWRLVRFFRVLVALPLSLPPVVAGIALLAAFGRKSPIGASMEAWGVSIAFSTAAVVVAQVFVSLPFLIVTLEAALRARPEGLEEMASSLGASPSRVLWRVTLPMVLPGLARGSALALARCLGEFGATLTFAGSMQGVTRTMPLQIYLARESNTELALALGAVLLMAATVVVALTELPRRIRRRRTAPAPPARAVPLPGPAAGGAVAVYVRGRVAARGWNVDISLPAGAVTAVMGHNGAGKSTLAQVVAGSLALDEGAVRIGERVVDSQGRFVGARDRGIAMVSQQPRIFGHMSVLANVAFPLRSRGVKRAEAASRALDQLRRVGMEGVAGRRGDELSGGQAARVAIARALIFDPSVLVLDEPTAALDVEATAQVSLVLRERLAATGVTTVLVTHDTVEALELAAHMVVMDSGRVVEEGAPAAVLARPSSVFAARLAGFNIVSGRARRGDGLVGVRVGGGTLYGAGDAPDGPVALLFAPEAVALSRAPVDASPRSQLPGRVESVDASGGVITVGVLLGAEPPFESDASGSASGSGVPGAGAGTPVPGPEPSLVPGSGEPVSVRARVTTAAWAELGLGVGDAVWSSIKATQVRAVPLAEPAAPAD